MTDIDIDLDDSNTSKLLRALVVEAKQDQKITEDERVLVKEIEKLLWDIENDIELLMEASNPDLLDKLRDMLLKVFDEARKIANMDGKITEEEENLLTVIGSYIRTDGLVNLMEQFTTMFKE